MVVGSKATDESVAKINSSVRPATGFMPPSLSTKNLMRLSRGGILQF